MRKAVVDLLVGREDLADLDPASRRLALRRVCSTTEGLSVTEVADEIDGFGILTSLVDDPRVTDVLVNGHDEIWVERDGTLELTGLSFEDAADLRSWIDRVMGEAGVRADVSAPIATGRMRDGSRVHVVLPPVSDGVPVVSIRCFAESRFSLADLELAGAASAEDRRRLEDAVEARRSIVISGATGAGKTTLAGALLSLVHPDERVILIEEVAELNPACRHRVRLLTRNANTEGAGAIDLARLVRAALRMRPDRIVVGEVRGPEAAVALRAMSCGHRGSILTVHAASAREAPSRLVDLALEADGGSSESSWERRLAAAVDVWVHMDRVNGERRIAEIRGA